MHSTCLEDRELALTDRLTADLDGFYGPGWMSSSIYDTAWVSLIVKSYGENSKQWLFPQCFEYILNHQQEDGAWPSYASQIDAILNTAASLLALTRHQKQPLQFQSPCLDSLGARISKAVDALHTLLNSWDVSKTVHVGFEILVPALLAYLKDEGHEFSFPQQDTLMVVNQQKLSKFHPSYLYAHKLTALHSLEAFVGQIEFAKVAHHKHQGSFMASPSSTAAFLINNPVWDDECEDYLRHTLSYGAGRRDGSVPSAFPSPVFELTWVSKTHMYHIS